MGDVLAFRRPDQEYQPQRGPDRRSTRRGGRRAEDRQGFAPLVLLLDDNSDSNARCEAILARLHFAVAPTKDINEAKSVMSALRPDIIVARLADAAELKNVTSADLPIVLLGNELLEPEALIEEIRRELRAHKNR